MRRYSTPKIRFHLKGNDLKTVLSGTGWLTFGKFNEETQDFAELFDIDYTTETDTNTGKTYLTCQLSQEQTALYAPNENAYVQFRAKVGSASIVSSITPVRALPTIKAEVL